jgi:acetylornithine/N-succinyldiaminopimelate aminotransferase
VEQFGEPAKVFFCNSGAEANEGAIKLARRYFWEKGEKRHRIITFKNSLSWKDLWGYVCYGPGENPKGL